MESNWIEDNRASFERDVLHEFCRASDLLFSQFDRLESSGAVSFPVLREMVGEPLSKGMLWRLKDKAHHLFRHGSPGDPVAVLLDWSLGYVFHETLKLMEDAHQRQYYAPQLAEIAVHGTAEHVKTLAGTLLTIQGQTLDSMEREVRRLDMLLARARELFALYFGGRADHQPLARLLYDKDALIRRAFKDDYDAFITAIYGDAPELLHAEAAASLFAGARLDEAAAALEKALAINPGCPRALELAATDGQRGATPSDSPQGG